MSEGVILDELDAVDAPWSAEDSNPLQDMKDFIEREKARPVEEARRRQATIKRMRSAVYQICVGPYLGLDRNGYKK